MRKIIFLTLLITTIAIFKVNAQSPIPIQFAKGKSSATVKGNTGSYGVTYKIRAKSGQKLILTLSPTAKVGIKVEMSGSDGELVLLRENRGGTYQIGLEENGEYTIFVGSTNNKSVPFTLTVKIGKLADI